MDNENKSLEDFSGTNMENMEWKKKNSFIST